MTGVFEFRDLYTDGEFQTLSEEWQNLAELSKITHKLSALHAKNTTSTVVTLLQRRKVLALWQLQVGMLTVVQQGIATDTPLYCYKAEKRLQFRYAQKSDLNARHEFKHRESMKLDPFFDPFKSRHGPQMALLVDNILHALYGDEASANEPGSSKKKIGVEDVIEDNRLIKFTAATMPKTVKTEIETKKRKRRKSGEEDFDGDGRKPTPATNSTTETPWTHGLTRLNTVHEILSYLDVNKKRATLLNSDSSLVEAAVGRLKECLGEAVPSTAELGAAMDRANISWKPMATTWEWKSLLEKYPVLSKTRFGPNQKTHFGLLQNSADSFAKEFGTTDKQAAAAARAENVRELVEVFRNAELSFEAVTTACNNLWNHRYPTKQ